MHNEWSDREYLREVQYRDATNVTARADIHRKYSSAAIPWFTWLAGQIQWPPRAMVLEVGCGPGWFWAQAVQTLPSHLRLTLTDLSPAMVDTAVQRVRAVSPVEIVDAREADVQNLPFESERFDVVVANHMLYHVADPARALAEIARVLKSSGCLLAATNGPKNLRELRELSGEVFTTSPRGDPTSSFSSLSAIPLLHGVFSDVRWLRYDDTLHCTESDDIVAYITSSPPGESATDDEIATLRRKIQERTEAHHGEFIMTKDTGAFVAGAPVRPRS